MAETYGTLAGLVQFNDKNLADLEVTDLLQDAPLMDVIFSQAASNGTLHKYLKLTTASSAAFRAANAGSSKTNSADTLVTDTLKILDGSFPVDVALANEAKNGKDAYLMMELMRTMKTVFSEAEKQVIYGTGNDASGFAGLSDDPQLDAVADAMVYNAGGTTDDAQTSVFLLRSGKDDVSFILGNDGQIVVDEDPTIVPWTPVESSIATYPAYYTPVTGYCGFQIGGAYSAARICNVNATDSAGAASLTDDMIYEALALFPASRQPNMIVLNRQSLKMLRASRTAVNATGAAAPRPTEVEGIPIIVTDSIVSTEAVEV